MARHHGGVFIQTVQALLDGTLDGCVVATPQVGATDAAAKQGIAGDQQFGLGR